MRKVLSILILFSASVCLAAGPCPRCGKYHGQTGGVAYYEPGGSQVVNSPMTGQAVAQLRADYMARTGRTGHPPRSVGNWAAFGSMEGVGWSSARVPHRSIGTCRPSGRSGAHDDNSRRLVGDAVAYGRGGSYRVRIWR